MKRTAIYLRVSSDRQAKEGDSIPAQRDALLKYIDSRSDLTFAGEYLDDGISGTIADRDELQKLLADVDEGKVDLIIFTKLDRWFRSVRHYTITQERLDRKGVGWTAIWEPLFDTTTPQGRLFTNQILSIAQFEAEQTGQRIRQVFRYKVEKGEVTSGKVTPGYMIKDKHLVPSELAPAVADAFALYAHTGCLSEVLRSSPKGLPVTAAGLRQMLRRRIYIGESHGNPDFCQPIVSREIFEQVQTQLDRNIKASQKHTHLFSGLVICAECGCRMTAMSRVVRGKKYKILRCSKHYGVSKHTCGNTKILTESVLEKYLLDNLADLIKDFRIRAEIAEAPARDTRRQRESLEKKIERLKELYVNDLISLDEYKRDKERYTAELDSLQIAAEPPRSRIDGFDPVQGINIYTALDETEKRLFWRLIIKEIRFGNDRSLDIIFL